MITLLSLLALFAWPRERLAIDTRGRCRFCSAGSGLAAVRSTALVSVIGSRRFPVPTLRPARVCSAFRRHARPQERPPAEARVRAGNPGRRHRARVASDPVDQHQAILRVLRRGRYRWNPRRGLRGALRAVCSRGHGHHHVEVEIEAPAAERFAQALGVGDARAIAIDATCCGRHEPATTPSVRVARSTADKTQRGESPTTRPVLPADSTIGSSPIRRATGKVNFRPQLPPQSIQTP